MKKNLLLVVLFLFAVMNGAHAQNFAELRRNLDAPLLGLDFFCIFGNTYKHNR